MILGTSGFIYTVENFYIENVTTKIEKRPYTGNRFKSKISYVAGMAGFY